MHELWFLKKGQKLNWEFDSQPQIPLKQGSNHFQLRNAIHYWKNLFQGYKKLPSYSPKNIDLTNIWTSKVSKE